MVFGVCVEGTKEMRDYYEQHKGEPFEGGGTLVGLDQGYGDEGEPLYVYMLEGSFLSFMRTKTIMNGQATVVEYR